VLRASGRSAGQAEGRRRKGQRRGTRERERERERGRERERERERERAREREERERERKRRLHLCAVKQMMMPLVITAVVAISSRMAYLGSVPSSAGAGQGQRGRAECTAGGPE
jgi:hypothetical protein